VRSLLKRPCHKGYRARHPEILNEYPAEKSLADFGATGHTAKRVTELKRELNEKNSKLAKD